MLPSATNSREPWEQCPDARFILASHYPEPERSHHIQLAMPTASFNSNATLPGLVAFGTSITRLRESWWTVAPARRKCSSRVGQGRPSDYRHRQIADSDHGSDADPDHGPWYDPADNSGCLCHSRQECQSTGAFRVLGDKVGYSVDMIGHAGLFEANSSTTLRPGSLSASLTVMPWMSATAATSDNPSPLPAVDRLRSSLKKR